MVLTNNAFYLEVADHCDAGATCAKISLKRGERGI